MKNKKGFTLIELLAVIVVLGIIMLIAVTSVSGVIEKTKKDSFVATARAYLDAVKKKVLLDGIVLTTGDDLRIYLDKTMVEKGGITSPYGRAYTILDSQPIDEDDYDDIDDLNGSFDTAVSYVYIDCWVGFGGGCYNSIYLSDGENATIYDDEPCYSMESFESGFDIPEEDLNSSFIRKLIECEP